MLGINVNVNADVRIGNYHYPIRFTNQNICVHCAAENAMKFVDKFGKDTKNYDLYPVQHIRCTKCGRNYGIKWESQEDGSMLPTAIEPDVKAMFTNLVLSKAIKATGKELLSMKPSI